MWGLSEVAYPALPTAAILVIGLALALLAGAIASAVWRHHSPAHDLSFSELMYWSWYRLQKAEERLGLGEHAAAAATSPEEQLVVLHELSDALESKDPYTRGHSQRVERHSFKIGVALGLPLKDVQILRTSASLHDVGKIRIPNRVLHNPGRLSDDEFSQIKEHPVLGAAMVANIGDQQIVETVLHHHERWDGGGYPDGIAGTQIPLFARIIAVADSYDAIRSTRSYRAGGSRTKATGIIQAERGHQFDPDVVRAFMTTLPARSPLVTVLMALTGPGALWRYLKQFFLRFGSAGLGPVIGAVGAAVVVLASPAFLDLDRPGAGALAAESSRVGSESSATGDADRLNATAASQRQERDRSLAEAKAEEARTERRLAAQKAAARLQRRREAARAAAAAPTATDTGSSTDPTTTDPTDGPVSEPDSGGTGTGDGSSVDGDPNPEGEDCPGRGEESKGSRRHCN